MITESLDVLLLEINSNPCLSTLSDNQTTLITKLLDDTLRYRYLNRSIAVDPVFGITKLSEQMAPANDSPDGFETDYELVHIHEIR